MIESNPPQTPSEVNGAVQVVSLIISALNRSQGNHRAGVENSKTRIESIIEILARTLKSLMVVVRDVPRSQPMVVFMVVWKNVIQVVVLPVRPSSRPTVTVGSTNSRFVVVNFTPIETIFNRSILNSYRAVKFVIGPPSVPYTLVNRSVIQLIAKPVESFVPNLVIVRGSFPTIKLVPIPSIIISSLVPLIHPPSKT